MFKRPGLRAFLLCAALLQAGALSAHHKGHHHNQGVLAPYPVADEIDMTKLLAPPPARGSAQETMEIDELLKIEAATTDAQAAAAVADHVYDVYRFADVLGPKFSAGSLPLTTALFAKVVESGKSVVDPAKNYWDRERPGQVDSRVRQLTKEPKSASYPSGHATAGTLMAIVLANMVPEKSAQLYARGWLFAQHRLMVGAHFPSDIQAGRITGTVVASCLFKDPEFKADFAAAKAELRTALGYPTAAE